MQAWAEVIGLAHRHEHHQSAQQKNPAAPAKREGWRKNGSECAKNNPKPKTYPIERRERKLSTIKFQFIHQNLISFNRFLCFRLSLYALLLVFSGVFLLISFIYPISFATLFLCFRLSFFAQAHSSSRTFFFGVIFRWASSLENLMPCHGRFFIYTLIAHVCTLLEFNYADFSGLVRIKRPLNWEIACISNRLIKNLLALFHVALFFAISSHEPAKLGFVRDSTWCYWTRHNPQSRSSQTLHFF